MAKTLERVARLQIVKFMESNNLFDPKQHGSRSGHSTISQILLQQDQILEGLQNDSNIDIIYIDFSKAFDKVDMGLLTHKIMSLEIIGNCGKWISSFFQNRKQRVIVNDEISDEEDIRSGIPQGSVMGPLLF